MDPSPAEQRSIFAEALDLPAGPERAAYLDAACRGDAGSLRRVEALLRAHERAGDFLASAPPRPTAARPGPR